MPFETSFSKLSDREKMKLERRGYRDRESHSDGKINRRISLFKFLREPSSDSKR